MDDPGNAFAVMTAFAFLAVIPIALALEGPHLTSEWAKAMDKGVDPTDLTLRLVGSGLAFYLCATALPSTSRTRAHAHAHTHDARNTNAHTHMHAHLITPPPHIRPRLTLTASAPSLLRRRSYNEVSFYTLDSVHPITHAVGNTIKRVILILYSVLRFGSVLDMQGKIGSAIAIGGVFAYSVAKQVVKKPKTA